MRFYTNVHQRFNEILVRGYENGKHFTLREEFNPTFYVPSKKDSKYKTLENGLKISDKNIVNEKNYWLIKASHNGFLKKFGIICERSLEYFVEKNKLIGTDKIITKNKLETKKYEFDFVIDL